MALVAFCDVTWGDARPSLCPRPACDGPLALQKVRQINAKVLQGCLLKLDPVPRRIPQPKVRTAIKETETGGHAERRARFTLLLTGRMPARAADSRLTRTTGAVDFKSGVAGVQKDIAAGVEIFAPAYCVSRICD